MSIFTYAGKAFQIISNEDSGFGNADIQVSLFNNGTLTSAFGFLDGVVVMPAIIPNGDSANDVIQLTTYNNNTGVGPAWRAGVIWDEQTQTNFGSPGGSNVTWENLYGGSRYGLPSASATVRYETIIGSSGDDLVKLDYNAANGGVAYAWDITIDSGDGRDLAIGGEGNDAIFGGSESSNLGDGLWGMGGNDTLYGGRNANFTTGADDLYGYAGNDTIYGANDGDVYYGDSGNDTIFAAGSGFILDSDTGNNVTMWGGGGDDTIFASISEVSSAQIYYGGNPSPNWVDASFVEQANNADTGLNDIVSYFGATNGVTLDLDVGVADEGLTRGTGTGGAAAGDRFYGIEHIIGSNTGNDNITGNAAANRLEGNGGNDVLSGDAGNDTLIGGGGADSLSGNADNDTVFGGTGADTIGGGGGGDSLDGGTAGEGNWLIYSNSEAVSVDIGANIATGLTVNSQANGDTIANFDNLVGGAGNDALTGSSLANTIYGGAGNDTIHGGGSGDSLAGGGDAGDFISYAASASGVSLNLATNAVSGGDGTGDTISGFLNAIGSASADSIVGTAGVNTIFGGAGNDTVEGGAGGDSLVGGGNAGDFISYANSASGVTLNLATNAVSGGDGASDTISGFLNAIGSGSADSISGTGGVNTIFGGAANDTIEGGAGGDSLDGGAGTGDFLSYANSVSGVNVTLAGNTVANGDASGDTIINFENIIGSAVNDGLTGDNNSNTIYGGTGVDTIDGLGGTDTMYGGANGDFLNYGNSGSSVQVNLTTGTATGGLGTDLFFGFQHILGSGSADILTGDTQNNSIVGAAGTDSIYGGAGIDTLFGDAGNDTIFAGDNGNVNNAVVSGWDGTNNAQINVTVAGTASQSSDYVFGGSEIDTLVITQASARNIYNTPNQNIASFLTGIEIIVAGASADVINLTFNQGGQRTAYTENVTVEAGSGNDVVFSGSGNDVLVGGVRTGSGDANNVDTLFGGQGNDLIYGDDFNVDNTTGGNDTLYGGGGLDTIVGGGGNDFVSDSDGGLLYGGHGSDLVVLIGSNGLDDYVASGGFVEVGGAIHPNAGTDGNDRVFVGGSYNNVQSDLGAGNDSFIASSSTLGTGFQTDVVTGGTGSDLISAWYGDDILYGDYGPSDTSGNGAADVIWGGAGVDTIYGGVGDDLLYGGAGNGDLLVGGDGADIYYWARTDGNDRIDDLDPTPTDRQTNYVLVFAGFQDPANPNDDLNGDSFIDGNGVFETDGDLYDNTGGNDMVQIVDDLSDGVGGLMRIQMLQGAGAGNSLTFNQNEVSIIGLGNSDTGQVQMYQWVADAGDPLGGRYMLM